MSTFYLLPPRPILADRFARLLQTVLPGLDWQTALRTNLLELVEATAQEHEGVYVVYREDLPQGEMPAQALSEVYGAERGDEVIEVCLAPGSGGFSSTRWRLR